MSGKPTDVRRWGGILSRDFSINWPLYAMALPVLAYFIIFNYVPMYGVTIAFKRYNPSLGVLGSPWTGFENFKNFFSSYYFWRLIRNTLLINVQNLLFGFPAPIILALLLNELRSKSLKATIQTISYIPHFVSTVVIAGIIIDFTRTDGLVNSLITALGGTASNLLTKPELFRGIFVGSGIWQEVGFGSIIYLAAITGINPELYESSRIDGAGRWGQLLHITLPSIMPTIIILLILKMGSMMNVGFEKIILLYNSMTYETADVISSFVYRKGLLEADYSYSTAVGLFNSLINFTLLVLANRVSRRVNETSLW
jgi:putative aldouronate transport system permease protein